MYKPSDVEILEAYDDYLLNMPDNDKSIGGAAIWLEAFKRGMRFNPVASQSGIENDVQKLSEHCQDCKEEFGHPDNYIECHKRGES